MTVHPGRSLALLALVLLAGCGGLLADGPTVTPAPVPTPSPTPTPQPTVVPGVHPDGGVRVDALLDRHRTALSNRSYTFTIDRVVRGPNGTDERVSTRLRVAPGASSYRLVQWANGTGSLRVTATERPVVDAWYNGSTVLFRGTDSTGTPYVVARNVSVGPVPDPTFRSLLRERLAGFEFRVAGRTADGVRLVATGAGTPEAVAPPSPFERPRNVSMRVTVTPGGVVQSTRLAYDATDGGRRVRVVRTTRVSAVGDTTVRVPAWAGFGNATDANATGGPGSDGTATG